MKRQQSEAAGWPVSDKHVMNLSAGNYARIFLLSHMRAFTSLAGHILGSHPAINGYFEMHISYHDASALARQLDVLQQHETLKPDSRYLFDKLLHNDYALMPERLGLEDIKILVALREPESTIKSIVDLFEKKETDHVYAIPGEAARYYIERLDFLADFCRTADRQYYYFDAGLLQSTPEMLLPAMTGWLELDPPLSGRYQIFSQTGEARKGDSSELIYSGKIDQARVDYPHIHIPQDQLESAQTAYRDCRQAIIENAIDSVTFQQQLA